MTFPVLPSNSATGYNLTKSLRFRSSVSAYLNRTPASTSSRTTWTWSGWVKLGRDPDGFFALFGADANGYPCSGIALTNYNIQYFSYTHPVYDWQKISTMVLQDPSAWYHIVAVTDTTNATAEDRARVYVNGQRITSWSTNNNPSPSFAGYVNSSSYVTKVGRIAGFGYLDGYMSEVNFVDGQALDSSYFGQTSTSTGAWIPKKYTGTYGTNGFYLKFTDTTSTSTLGTDFSGNSNTFTVNNFSLTASATYDSMTDVPTLTSATTANYCVLSPVDVPTTGSPATLSDGNLKCVTPSSGYGFTTGTIATSSGKWYWEYLATAGSPNLSLGFGLTTCARTYGGDTGSYIYYAGDGRTYANAGAGVTYGATWTNGDVIAVALDLDAGTAVFYKNNVSQGTAFTGLSGTFFPIFSDQSPSVSNTFTVNFGQQPFTYTPPTGFVGLNTFNLSTPTIGATASTTANKYFDVTLWTGNSGTQSITNSGSMQPDCVWIKNRTGGNNHARFDSVRGATLRLYETTLDEQTETNTLTSFNSNGFSLGSGPAVNSTSNNYVGWQWKAGGAAVTNTAGTITSTISANTTSGFSVVTYTGNATSSQTVGHGLGVTPTLFILKSRGVQVWNVYSLAAGITGNTILQLNDTDGSVTGGNISLTASSTTIGFGSASQVNGSGVNFVAYCFAPVAGYSSFGSYVGNSSNDGTFIYTGFRPAFVLYKKANGVDGWYIFDTKRNPYNLANASLRADSSSAEVVDGPGQILILSNGFKQANANTIGNSSSFTYIYMAFAEYPFKYANAR